MWGWGRVVLWVVLRSGGWGGGEWGGRGYGAVSSPSLSTILLGEGGTGGAALALFSCFA